MLNKNFLESNLFNGFIDSSVYLIPVRPIIPLRRNIGFFELRITWNALTRDMEGRSIPFFKREPIAGRLLFLLDQQMFKLEFGTLNGYYRDYFFHLDKAKGDRNYQVDEAVHAFRHKYARYLS